MEQKKLKNIYSDNLPIEKPIFTVQDTFKFLMLLASVLHLIFYIIFSSKSLIALTYFNIISIFLYLVVYFYIVDTKFLLSVCLVFIEILIHTILCVYYIGWKYGFFGYPLCMLPVVYFASIHSTNKWIFGHISSTIIFVALLFLKVYSFNNAGIYEDAFENIELYFYLFNIISSGFIMNILIISYLYEMKFSREVFDHFIVLSAELSV